ncbi:MAG TPA: hypothetical protein VEY67_06375 [Candidatus Dormibacteraeota bacterium]|nr:hypothetical protein [Candidatus Dormibacteraeota bacterium]
MTLNVLSLKYAGRRYGRRSPRGVFTIEIDRVGHPGSWKGRGGFRP